MKGHSVADSGRKARQGRQSTRLKKYHLSRCLEVVHLKLVGLCTKRIQSVLLGCFFKAVSLLRLGALLHSMTDIHINTSNTECTPGLLLQSRKLPVAWHTPTEHDRHSHQHIKYTVYSCAASSKP